MRAIVHWVSWRKYERVVDRFGNSGLLLNFSTHALLNIGYGTVLGLGCSLVAWERKRQHIEWLSKSQGFQNSLLCEGIVQIEHYADHSNSVFASILCSVSLLLSIVELINVYAEVLKLDTWRRPRVLLDGISNDWGLSTLHQWFISHQSSFDKL